MSVHSTVPQLFFPSPASWASSACVWCGTRPQDSHESTRLGQTELEGPGWAYVEISSFSKGRFWSRQGQRDSQLPSKLTDRSYHPGGQGPKSTVRASRQPAGPQGKACRNTSPHTNHSSRARFHPNQEKVFLRETSSHAA